MRQFSVDLKVAGTLCGECLNGIHTVDLVPSATHSLEDMDGTRRVPATFSVPLRDSDNKKCKLYEDCATMYNLSHKS